MAGGNHVAVISDSLFVRRFGSNPAILGQPIRLDDGLYTIVGVLAKDFRFGSQNENVDIWIPLGPIQDRRKAQFLMLARMRPGININAARAFVTATAKRLDEIAHPYRGPNGEDAGYRANVVSLHDQMFGHFRRGALLLSSAVPLMFLVACVNVAHLLLARTAAREKEIAIRQALGASRLMLVRQSLTETAVLAAFGATAGYICSRWAIALLARIAGQELPANAQMSADWRPLLFTFCISCLVCVLFALIPAMRGTAPATLRGPRRKRGVSRILVASQVALALILLIGSGLLLKSFAHLLQIDPGFRTDHLLTFELQLAGHRYEKVRARTEFFSKLQSRLSGLPGAISVSATDRLPVFTAGVDTRSGNPFSIDGHPWNPNASTPQIAHTGTVGLDYFRSLRVPLLAGRAFAPSDTMDTPPVAVINKTLLRKFFPHDDAIGRHILLGAPEPGARWLTIVGVVGDVRTGALDLPPMPQFYMPEAQDSNSRMFIVLRTAIDPDLMTRSASAVVRQLDPAEAATHFQTMEEHVAATVQQPRFQAILLTFFAASALFLAAIGLYGVVEHATVQRTKEISIRMALGAGRTRVVTTILADGLSPVLVGITVGLVGAIGLAQFLGSILYGVKPGDPVIFVCAVVLLAVTGVFACLMPARRAARLNPALVLRGE
jgi:putative ABC transport system permease protein